MSGKCVGDTISLLAHKHVHAFYQSGLQGVTEELITIFLCFRSLFCVQTKTVAKDNVSELLEDCVMLGTLHKTKVTKVRQSFPDNTKKDIAWKTS